EFWDAAIFPKSAAFDCEISGSSPDWWSSISTWHVLQHALQQELAHARMSSGVHASTRLVYACSPACMPALDSCMHVFRRARQHEPRVRMFSGVHASTSLVYACSSTYNPAPGTCTNVLPRACQHKARVRMFSRVHASTSLMHACPPDQIARRNTRSRSAGLTPLSHSRNSRGVVRHSTLTLTRSAIPRLHTSHS